MQSYEFGLYVFMLAAFLALFTLVYLRLTRSWSTR